jgi:DNA recombination protein RmuC
MDSSALVLLFVLLVVVIGLLGFLVMTLRGGSGPLQDPHTGAASSANIDNHQLVEMVRAAVDAQVRATTADTVAQTSRQAGEMLEQRGAVIAEQTKGLLDPIAQQMQILQNTVGEMKATFEQDKGAVTEMSANLIQQIGALNGVTSELAGALRSPAARGAWGENQLRNIIELAGMAPYCDFSEQTTFTNDEGRQRPDLTVRLPNGAFLVVDSKVPLAAYLDMQGATEEAVRTAKLSEHARATRSHVRALAEKKYWAQFPESPDFVVMFVPGESFLADALRAESSLMDEAMRSRVVITSPMSLMALLLTVARGWQTRQMAESATQIATEAAEFYKRIGVVLGHLEKTGRHIDSTANAYNELVGSFERRVMPTLRRLSELGVPGDINAEPRVIDHATRAINLPEMPAGQLEA